MTSHWTSLIPSSHLWCTTPARSLVSVLPAWILQGFQVRGFVGAKRALLSRSHLPSCQSSNAPAAVSGCLRRCASQRFARCHHRLLQKPCFLHSALAALPRLLMKCDGSSPGMRDSLCRIAVSRDCNLSSSAAICFWGGHRLNRYSAVGSTVRDIIFILWPREIPRVFACPALLQKALYIAARVASQHGLIDAL